MKVTTPFFDSYGAFDITNSIALAFMANGTFPFSTSGTMGAAKNLTRSGDSFIGIPGAAYMATGWIDLAAGPSYTQSDSFFVFANSTGGVASPSPRIFLPTSTTNQLRVPFTTYFVVGPTGIFSLGISNYKNAVVSYAAIAMFKRIS